MLLRNRPRPQAQAQAKSYMVGDKIRITMSENQLSIRDLAWKVDGSYENIRRIVNGQSLPSKFLLNSISDILGLNKEEMSHTLKVDQMGKTFGTLPLEMAGKKPSMEPLERVWDDLNKQQQAGILKMAQGWADQNRAARS